MDPSGSPTKKKSSAAFNIFDDINAKKKAMGPSSFAHHDSNDMNAQSFNHTNDLQHSLKRSQSVWPLPTLNTRPVGPQFSSQNGRPQMHQQNSGFQAGNHPPMTTYPEFVHAPQPSQSDQEAVDELMAKLSKHKVDAARKKDPRSEFEDGHSSPATDPYENITPSSSTLKTEWIDPDAAELNRLKQELANANARVAQMDHELAQSRITQHTVEEALGSPFPAAQRLAFNMAGPHQNNGRGNITPMPVTPAPLSAPLSQAPWRVDSMMPNYNDMFASNQATDPVGPRPSSAFGNRKAQQYAGPVPLMTSASFPSPYVLPNGLPHVQQPPIGTKLSPTAAEFPANGNFGFNGPNMMGMGYNGRMMNGADRTRMASDPVNYRQLLDRTVNCDWKFIVDKIIGGNDQQASIFLQQKLKIGNADQKFEIVRAIVDQAYPLMINRFGNFLVQRCFEHGTPEQIIAIGNAIRGNVLNLSMDAFGCHVVQKAFDCVPEEYKALMVHELLRRIPETVVHRYACHVWQKLFELRWSGCPPQIMRHVNDALRGMWHEVALGETGSLVVQNIFENCLEEDKRPCVNEVLASIDVVAHGQFGNWCIQHICEHGSDGDRNRAIDHIIRFAFEYSTDQFASKVVEKCLKIGGNDFLDRYLAGICEPRPECPRMALIDIAGDQFGNYLIQYILTNSEPQRRELVASHIRKHTVSLRGSKYGSRVAMLCSNPAFSIRPGPPPGMGPVRNLSHQDRFVGEAGRGFGGYGRGGYSGGYR